MLKIPNLYKQPARSFDWAVSFWILFVTALSVLAFLECNSFASLSATIAIVICPKSIGIFRRILLIFVAISLIFLGGESLIIAWPIALFISKHEVEAVVTLAIFSGTFLLSHHIDTFPEKEFIQLPIQSFICISIPSIVSAISYGRYFGKKAWISLLTTLVIFYFCLDLSFSNGFFSVNYLTNPFKRTIISLIPISIIFPLTKQVSTYLRLPRILLITSFLIGIAFISVLPKRNIDGVIFDEGHGPWETVTSSFGPNDFGRGANYTYSLLYKYTQKLSPRVGIITSEIQTLPSTDSVFIVKVPTLEFSTKYRDRIKNWVNSGGRLIVIADHTDLFDTTQHMNNLIEPFGAKIQSDAVFNSRGMPNQSLFSPILSMFGRIDVYPQKLGWQTGASISKSPLSSVSLASFGPSFKEKADYSGINRFGTFQPRPSLAYTVPSAIIVFPFGQGGVTIFLDSTPWSNFSLFKEPYKDLYRSLLEVQTHFTAMKFLGRVGFFLLVLGIIFSLFPTSKITTLITVTTLGGVLMAGYIIGSTSHTAPKEGRDYDLMIGLGKNAYMEFLNQLVPSGAFNYSRIISSTEKYGRNPRAYDLNATPDLTKANHWLLIEPNSRFLPSRTKTLEHLKRGGNLTIMFSTESAKDTSIVNWLDGLGLHITAFSGLAIGEDYTPEIGGILNRRQPTLFRTIRTITKAKPTSLLKEYISDNLFQTYELRPSNYPKTKGLLTIGFSSDQFSDNAISDVWEGVDPGSLGKFQERQFEKALSGEARQSFPHDLLLPDRYTETISGLNQFVVVQDGRVVAKGNLINNLQLKTGTKPSPRENQNDYLLDLRARALEFIEESCPKKDKTTQCDMRFLGPSLMEWIVFWSASDKKEPLAIELIHERRFSGTGSTWNVIFSE